MHRVEAKRVDVKVTNPMKRVLDEVVAHFVAVGSVEIQRFAPRRPVSLGEIRGEVAEVVAFGAEVVVDDVEHDREPETVARVDETFERGGPTVAVLHRERVDAVVAPVALSRKLGDGHELDRGDPEIPKPLESTRRGVERSFERKRPDVELVDNQLFEGSVAPRAVGPIELGGDDLRRTVDALRLQPRRWVRIGGPAVEPVAVARARRHAVDHRRMVAAVAALERDDALAGRQT